VKSTLHAIVLMVFDLNPFKPVTFCYDNQIIGGHTCQGKSKNKNIGSADKRFGGFALKE